MELPDGYTISARRRNTTSIVELKDANGTTIKTFSGESGLINELKTEATQYAIERDQLRSNEEERETYRESIADTIDDLDIKLKRYEQIAESADLTTSEGQSAYFVSMQQQELMTQQLLTLRLLNQQLDTKVKNEEGEEEDKWGLKEIGMILTLTASGLTLGDSLIKLFEDDDIAPIDVKEELLQSNRTANLS